MSRVRQAKRKARIMGTLTQLVAVKSGGTQLLNHILMFVSLLILTFFVIEHQPREPTLHAMALIEARVRPYLTPASRDGSYAALR